MSQIKPSGNVVVIGGGGNVGAAVAFNLVSENIANKITLIDIAQEMAEAQAFDIQDAANFTFGSIVDAGGYKDLQDGDIVVITCGAAQKPGQARLDLLETNVKILRSVLSEIKKTGKNVYIIVVANPVDVLTYVAIKESGLPESQVFGSGTFLDTGRLRVYLGRKFDINPDSVQVYVLGEHGNSSFPALGRATMGGIPLEHFMELSDRAYEQVAHEVRDQAYKIIRGKGATAYGIGAAVGDLCRMIIRDENRIVAVSVMSHGCYGQEEVVFGMPMKLGAGGVKFEGELKLNELEQKMLGKSCDVLRDSIRSIEGYKGVS